MQDDQKDFAEAVLNSWKHGLLIERTDLESSSSRKVAHEMSADDAFFWQEIMS